MTRKLFGTDGVRGLANEDPMTPETAFRIGLAVAHQLRTRLPHQPRVIIGKDTRVSGYMLETALASGICAMGGQVMLSGPLPTPAVAYLTQSMRADAGVVISASHNPYADNGIKIFGADGYKLPDADEEELEALVLGPGPGNRPTGEHIGTALRLDDARGRYVAFCKGSFPRDLTLEGMRVVVDAANGAAYRAAPQVFAELGADVITVGDKPDGTNINERCGALHPEHAAREVLKGRADLGITLDGDADRVILIDEKGQRVDGDVIMGLVATRMLKTRALRKKTLVATVMSNLGLQRAIEAAGGKLVRCAVGDRYVVETMRKGGYCFGGEQSGHLIFLDHATTGDGIIAALQVLAIMLREKRPMSELASSVLQRVPQVLVNVTLKRRRPLEQMPKTLAAIAATEKKLGRDGRVLVRWSGTEAKLRVMIEGPQADKIEQMAKAIAATAEADVAV